MTSKRRARPGEARAFLEKALDTETDECIVWPFATNEHGYGIVRVDGRSQIASRVVLTRVAGDGPGLDAAHSCRETACINRRHLSWRTHRQNVVDDRRRDGTFLEGEDAPTSKLTADQVREIRERYGKRGRYERGDVTQAELAEEYGVSQATINYVIWRDRWACLD